MELHERRQQIEPPQLPAWLEGTYWVVWCPWCRTYHTHGLPLGHRVAHCRSQGGCGFGESPFVETGYVPVVLGDNPEWLRKDRRRRRRPQSPPPEVQAERPDLFRLTVPAVPAPDPASRHTAAVLRFKPRGGGRRRSVPT